MNKETVSAALLASLEAKVKDYYISNAIYKSKISESVHSRAAVEQEVRAICLHCDECRCSLENFSGDELFDPLPQCERFQQYFETLKNFAKVLNIRFDEAADGETDSFFEFL